MPRYSHLLDTSALLAHYFDEPGAAEVDAIWQHPANAPAISVLTLVELRTRLAVEVPSPEEVERVFDLYVNQLTVPLTVDRAVAEEARRLRESSPNRLPLVDACIAGTARLHGSILVHRDPHMDQLPPDSVSQLRLPDRS